LPIGGLEASGGGAILKVYAGRAIWRLAAGVLAPIVTLALSAPCAFAQSASSISPLYQGILTRPSDLNNTLQYAADASADDIESAIGTYEQLLFYNPTLSRVRFELGVLYFRLGSYEMARQYFQTALQMRDITPDLQYRTEDLMAVIDKKLQADQFTGYVQTGLAYQTNPGSAPGTQAALASGRAFNPNFFSKPDWNWFGAFTVNYVHDFKDQSSNTFEAQLVGYDAQEFKLHQFDVGLLEFRAGPRFGILTGDPNSHLSIKPYVVATGALLADAPFYNGIGGGLTVHANIGNVALDPYAEYVQQNFQNSTLYPLASGLSGPLQTYVMQASGPLSSGLGWQARGGYGHSDANYNPYGYDLWLADLWLPWNFSLPGDGRVWTLTPSVGFSRWLYNAPDPLVDPTITARTTEWRAGLGLDIPIWRQLYVSTLLQYRADTSNITIYSMRDLSISAGPTFKF
jgi:tetratricopeptide (TPR) repeat protein